MSAVREVRNFPPRSSFAEEVVEVPGSVSSFSAGTDVNVANLQDVRQLGEGQYGRVWLVVDRQNPSAALAVKRIDLCNDEDLHMCLRKEAQLQRMVGNHRNVLKCLSMRVTGMDLFEIFLEYAEGGELFDRVEPDVGMPSYRACFYFRQLMDGLEYVHSKGIVHRDIKLDNLLVTKADVLKICDFGMATLFRYGNKDRLLDLACGTTPYSAPEVYRSRYSGPPVDVWSSGVVLVALLTGQLPWEGKENFVEFPYE